MGSNTINLKVDKIIIHKIFKRTVKEEIIQPVYNNTCSNLDIEAKRAFVKRLTKAFGDDDHSLKMDISNTENGSVYELIKDFWMTDQSDEKLVNLSKKLTIKLAEVQNNCKYSDGVILTVKGTTKAIDADYIAIIKAEIQDGFNLIDLNGEQLLSYVNNLLLTRQQRLNKIGFFINNQVKGRKIEKLNVSAYLYDSNTDDSVAKAKADFFYNKFLGLKFSEDDAVFANTFYSHAKNFISKMESKPLEKLRLQTYLKEYIFLRQSPNINPAEFAEESFKAPDVIDSFMTSLDMAGVPRRLIRRDLKMIGDKKRKISFENSVMLQVPTLEFNDCVDVSEDNQGNTIIKIKGKYLDER